MTAAICFLDTETDGIHPGRKAWEVALIRREPSGTEHVEQFFLPIDLSTADPNGLRIGRFYDRHPLGIRLSNPPGVRAGTTKDAASAARIVARMTHGAHIVGAVPNFDTEILEQLLRGHGLAPSWHFRLRCVETLTAGHLRRPVGGLVDCATALGITPTDVHTALGDARTAQAIYDHVMETAA